MFEKLINEINFFKASVAPEVWNLTRTPNIWFGDAVAESTINKNFAIFDRKLLKLVLENGIIDSRKHVYEYNEFLLNNDNVRNFLANISNEYSKLFPGLNPEQVINNVKNQNSEYGGIENILFMIIHDLIHNVLDSKFVESLSNREDDTTSLLDELNEDLASSVSNFEPNPSGQGIFKYIKQLFCDFYLNNEFDKYKENPEQKIIDAIIKSIGHAKLELRGKIDKIVSNNTIRLNRIKKSPKFSNQAKQLLDGFLSKIKNNLINQVKNTNFENPFDLFEISEKINFDDLLDEWYERIRDSSVLNQTEGSALSIWLRYVFGEMDKLYNNIEQDLQYSYEDE